MAYAKNHIIGNHGLIPWMGKIPADMQHVRTLTKNNAIIMGLNTFNSIGKPLLHRQNIVLVPEGFDVTSAERLQKYADEVTVCHSLDEAFARVPADRTAFVFGGASVYREAMRRADALQIDIIYVTEIQDNFNGDVSFPEIYPAEWTETAREDFTKDDKNLFDYSFIKYERIK